MKISAADRCPVCKSHEVSAFDYMNEDSSFGEFGMECGACGHEGAESTFWPTREELNLPADHCAACHRRRTWGCGHTFEQELAALAHQDTTEHLLGDCDCFVSRPGYVAKHTREDWRERVALVVKAIRDEKDDEADVLSRQLGW